ncbi:hypothetical protein GCM10011491_27010 [Brucella endophytica]|uniref:Uncharacterized protein n=1 Tax=Brucella endophytica TaxID=1963359 RepID=A0A916SF89_9HYPH|nr:hypothetical protein GCM10011491_27010 [Brucella endophytica]
MKTGGGDGTFDGMEARVAKLESLAEGTRNTLDSMGRELVRIEAKIDSLASTVEKVADKVDRLTSDVAELKGRVSQMPTIFQLLGMVFAIMGATFAFIRFGLAGL